MPELHQERLEHDYPSPALGAIQVSESLSAVPAEADLVEIALQVLAAQAMIDAVFARSRMPPSPSAVPLWTSSRTYSRSLWITVSISNPMSVAAAVKLFSLSLTKSEPGATIGFRAAVMSAVDSCGITMARASPPRWIAIRTLGFLVPYLEAPASRPCAILALRRGTSRQSRWCRTALVQCRCGDASSHGSHAPCAKPWPE